MECSNCPKKDELIRRLKHILDEAENHEIYDVINGIYSLLKDLGLKVGYDPVWNSYYLIEDEHDM